MSRVKLPQQKYINPFGGFQSLRYHSLLHACSNVEPRPCSMSKRFLTPLTHHLFTHHHCPSQPPIHQAL